MDIPELEARLANAQARKQRSLDQLRGTFDTAARAEADTADAELLSAERALALAKGEETAMPCEWPVPWDIGAPLPMVLASGRKTYLLYIVSVPDPDWDGTYVRVVNPASAAEETIALVEFIRCREFKFGGPNDEVIHGHPLYGKGLTPYRAHFVANSQWLAELQQINSVHSRFSPDFWTDVKHYLLLFHDEMFECLAEGHKIEVFKGSVSAVVDVARRRLFGG